MMKTSEVYKAQEIERANYGCLKVIKSFRVKDRVNLINRTMKRGSILCINTTDKDRFGFVGYVQVKWDNGETSWLLGCNLELNKETQKAHVFNLVEKFKEEYAKVTAEQ